jgi:hypothetical protein
LQKLRRLAETPNKVENYFKAEIVSGQTGQDQSGMRVEFDLDSRRSPAFDSREDENEKAINSGGSGVYSI